MLQHDVVRLVQPLQPGQRQQPDLEAAEPLGPQRSRVRAVDALESLVDQIEQSGIRLAPEPSSQRCADGVSAKASATTAAAATAAPAVEAAAALFSPENAATAAHPRPRPATNSGVNFFQNGA